MEKKVVGVIVMSILFLGFIGFILIGELMPKAEVKEREEKPAPTPTPTPTPLPPTPTITSSPSPSPTSTPTLTTSPEPKPLVKERLEITTINRVRGEEWKNVMVKPWQEITEVEVHVAITGVEFGPAYIRYEIDSDVDWYLDLGSHELRSSIKGIGVDEAYTVEFNRELKVYVVYPPALEEEYAEGRLQIEIFDTEPASPLLNKIVEFEGWNESTVIIKWLQPDQPIPPQAIVWKHLNVTVIEIDREEGKYKVYTFRGPPIWPPTDTVLVWVCASGEGQTLEYKIETDLETLEGITDCGTVGVVQFHDRIVIHVIPIPMPIPQASISLSICCTNYKYTREKLEISLFCDELTMILQWEET